MEVKMRKAEPAEKEQLIPATTEKLETAKPPPPPPPPPKRPVGRPRKEDSTGAGAASHAKTDKPIAPKPPIKPTIRPPDFTEWTEFFGTVVLRWVTRAITAVILHGVDRKILEPDELDDIDLDEEQLTAIAKPFAHVATRSAFLTKHGREILDSKDAIEAAVIMFMWMGRVNRIAKKYRPRHERTTVNGTVDSGQDVSANQGNNYVAAPAVGSGFN